MTESVGHDGPVEGVEESQWGFAHVVDREVMSLLGGSRECQAPSSLRLVCCMSDEVTGDNLATWMAQRWGKQRS
jgi:hypothetical protein